MNATNVISLIATLCSFILVIIAWRKAKPEARQIESSSYNLDADTAAKYQEIANLAAEHTLGLEKRVTNLETERDDLRNEVAGMKESIRSKDDEIAALRDWAERLVHQVQSLGATPVKLKLTKAEVK